MSTRREIEEVYNDEIRKKRRMSKGIVAEPLSEVIEVEPEKDEPDFSWCGMCVYFILDEKSNAVKIGRTRGSVVDRLVEIQVGNPNELRIIGVIPKLISGGYSERELHRKFKDIHIRGEWFQYEDKIKSFILNLPKYCQQEESP